MRSRVREARCFTDFVITGRARGPSTARLPDPVTYPPMLVELVLSVVLPLGLDLYLPVPAANPLTMEKIERGRRLFFDRRHPASGAVRRGEARTCGVSPVAHGRTSGEPAAG